MNIVYAYSEGVADVTLAPKSANQNSTKVISMWVLIYAFLGFLYFLASTWKPIFSTIGIEALFPVYTFINIFASFCIYFYHDFRKEPCKNKWYKFVLGNLLTVVLFVGLFFGYAVFALHDM